MRKPGCRTVFAFFLVLSCCVPAAGAQSTGRESAPPQVIAAGSGVNLGITRELAEAFMKDHPEIKIEVPGSIGSKGAIKAAADGAISIGLMSRPLKEDERGLGLAVLPYARTGIVVAAHPNVPDEELSYDDLVNIYKGTKTTWKDGNDIVVQIRDQFDSGFMVLEEKIPGLKEALAEARKTRRWSMFFTDQDANRALTTVPYAIGATDIGMIATERLQVKILKLNGLLPTPENLAAGAYPLARTLSFVYRKDKLSEEARSFLDFVRSDNGAAILKSMGYVPENQGM